MTKEFTIEQIRSFVDKKYQSVSARFVESLLLHYDELAAQTAELQKEVERIRGLLYERVTAGAIDKHTKNYTWQQFKTENNL